MRHEGIKNNIDMYNYCITYKGENMYRAALMNIRGANKQEVKAAFHRMYPEYELIDIV